jgi:hypothetical protein
MTPHALAKSLFSCYEQYRLDSLRPEKCTHEPILLEMIELAARSKKRLALEEVGSSLEGRSINIVRCGSGATSILLWSQMHGDESTATLAIMDALNFIAERDESHTWVDEMLARITINCMIMLNPDGAERRQRRTAAGIDMNRDALVRATPEAQLLYTVQDRLKPSFGFNLHDQELSSVGTSKNVTAIALLAPALDERRSKPSVRVRAMRVCAFMARTLDLFVPGHIATYDDTFEPRAFGDNMQKWGTSTILVESGHWPKDRGKDFIRKLNTVVLLTTLRSIANGSYQDVDLDHYLNLPPNGKRIYDVIIRNVTLTHRDGWTHRADVGLAVDPAMPAPGAPMFIKERGDLHHLGALETIDGSQRRISVTDLRVDQKILLDDLLQRLQLYHPVA